jgi:hypothetical protein
MSIKIIEDEIDKKAREIRERPGSHVPFSPVEVKNKKPGRIYRAAYNDPRRISELKSEGYEFCKDEEFSVDDKKSDGTHVYKDVVLMSVDQDVYTSRQARHRAEIQNQSLFVRERARENINRISVDEGNANPREDLTWDDSREGSTQTLSRDMSPIEE